MSGAPSRARVIGYYYNGINSVPAGGMALTTNPETGQIIWNDEVPRQGSMDGRADAKDYGSVFDYGLYDESSGGFWGANFAESADKNPDGSNVTYCKLYNMVDYFKNYKGRLIFCVLCEGNDPTKQIQTPRADGLGNGPSPY